MTWTKDTKPTTSYNPVSQPSVLQSPRIDRVSTIINDINETINNYTISIYDEVSKPS